MTDATTVSPMQARTEDFTRTVHALFDSRDEAEKARQDLLAAGLTDSDVTLIGAEAGEAESAAAEPPKEGFWETIKQLFMPEEDRYSYAEGVRRGGFTVAVKTDTATHDRVIDILDRDGAVDLDEREESWKSEGWTGYTARDPLVDSTTREPGTVPPVEEAPAYEKPTAATAGFGASAADHLAVDAAPPIESPGALPEAERLSDPAHALDPPADVPVATTGAPPVEPVPPGSGPAGSPLDVDFTPTSSPSGTRDLSHGRSRVRVYVNGSEASKPSDENR